jgi:hypothetical protein
VAHVALGCWLARPVLLPYPAGVRACAWWPRLAGPWLGHGGQEKLSAALGAASAGAGGMGVWDTPIGCEGAQPFGQAAPMAVMVGPGASTARSDITALTVIVTSKRQRASPQLSLACTRVNARTHLQKPQALTVLPTMPSCSVHARQRTLLPVGQTRAPVLVESFTHSVPCSFAADQQRLAPAMRARACIILHAAWCAVSSTHRQGSHFNPSLESQVMECWRLVNCE